MIHEMVWTILIMSIIMIVLFGRLFMKNKKDIEGTGLLALLMRISGQYNKSQIIQLTKKNNDVIKMLLKDSSVINKGVGMEYLLAMPGWTPVINSESVDGNVHKLLKKLIISITKSININNNSFDMIFKKNLKQLLSKNEMKFDSHVCTKVIIASFFQILFEESIFDLKHNNYLNDLFQFVEFMRKCIIAKGYNNINYKKECITKGMNIIRNNTKMNDIINKFEQENQHLFVDNDMLKESIIFSAIFQPFIISPGINFSDIYGPMFKRIYDDNKIINEIIQNVNNNKIKYINGLLFETLRLYHPFPLIERDIEKNIYNNNKITFKKNTHIFIPIGSYFNKNNSTEKELEFNPNNWMDSKNEINKKYKWMTFMIGQRRCIGDRIAIKVNQIILKSLFKKFNSKENVKKYIIPFEGNTISGRLNDENNPFIFLIIRLAKMLWKGIKYRFGYKTFNL